MKKLSKSTQDEKPTEKRRIIFSSFSESVYNLTPGMPGYDSMRPSLDVPSDQCERNADRVCNRLSKTVFI